MATQLNKTKQTKTGLKSCNVVRELTIFHRQGIKGKPLIVELEMGNYISFRAKGSRTKFTVSLGNVYYLAMMASISERYEKKMQAYNVRKSAGLRAIKPKRPRLVGVSPDVLHALSMKVK